MNFQLTRGDTRSITIPLALRGVAYAAPEGTQFILSIKRSLSDADELAVIQKATGAGLTYASNAATAEFVPADTRNQAVQRLVYDVQAHEPDGEVYTVALGTASITGDVTHGTDTAIPIYTTNPTAFQSAEESAAAAATSEAIATTKAGEAAASAVATAADRVQTGLDRVATGNAKTAAETAATTAVEAVGNIMVLVAQDDTSATFAVGDNITVEDGAGTYPTAIITFPN